MPDTKGPDKQDNDKREFMREKIVKQPMSKRQLVKRLAAFLCLAVMFGVIAAVSFVLSKPLADRYLGSDSSRESPSIVFTKDEPETDATEPAEETTRSETTDEQFREAVSEAVEEYQFSKDTLTAIYDSMKEQMQTADKGIVTVRSGKQLVDMFGNPVEDTGIYAGLIVAKTSEEYLIFTYADAVHQADSISVKFYEGTELGGQTRQIDEVLDMAVVSVSTSSMPSELKKNIIPIELGNSYSVKSGDFIIGAGAPAGVVHSTTYGSVSYVAKNVQMVDGAARILYADLHSNSRIGTFLLNMSGEMVGWTTDAYKTEDNSSITTAIGISDYKSVLEKMINGAAAPYFGIKGQEVNSSMWNAGIPSGVYVTESVQGSPAYDAGIQSGDIIIRFGEKDIGTFKELQLQIENSMSGSSVTVVVMRKGRDGYTELEYQVDIRAR